MKKTIAFLLSTCFMVGIAIAQTPTPRPATMPSIQAQRLNAQSPAEAEKACPHHAQHHDQASMPQHQCKNQCDQHKGDKQCKGDCDQHKGDKKCKGDCDQHKGDKKCKGNCDQHKGPQPGNHCDKGGCKEGKRCGALELSVGLGTMNALNNSALSLLPSTDAQYKTLGTNIELGYRFPSRTSLTLRLNSGSYYLANNISEEVMLDQIGLMARSFMPMGKKTSFVYGVGVNLTARSNYYEYTNPTTSVSSTLVDDPIGTFGMGVNFECGFERQFDRHTAFRIVAFADFANTETFSSYMNGGIDLSGTALSGFSTNPYNRILTAGIRCNLSLFVPTQKKK